MVSQRKNNLFVSAFGPPIFVGSDVLHILSIRQSLVR